MDVKKRIELFIKKNGFNPLPMYLCPKFERCDLNRCVLSWEYKNLQNDPLDYGILTKERCIPKSIRKQIGEYFNLPNGGLREKELAAMKKWDSMSQEQQEAKKQELRKNSPFLRLKAKGYGIVRVKEKELNFTLTNEPKLLKNEVLEADSKETEGEF